MGKIVFYESIALSVATADVCTMVFLHRGILSTRLSSALPTRKSLHI